jgi:hypothetical protein
MRVAALLLVSLASLAVLLGVTAESGQGAQQAVAVRSCASVNPWLAIQLVGDRDMVHFARFRSAPFPSKRTAIAVWSLGGPSSAGGTAIHGWITSAKGGFSARCTTVRAALKPPALSALGPATRVKDGLFTGQKATCDWRGRILIEERSISGGNRIVVRTQKGGSVLAVGEVAKGGGWLRASKRCISAER